MDHFVDAAIMKFKEKQRKLTQANHKEQTNVYDLDRPKRDYSDIQEHEMILLEWMNFSRIGENQN